MKYALLVGINYQKYSQKTKLVGCTNDIENIKNLLIDHYNYVPHNITMLCDDSNYLEQPTQYNILYELKNLVRKSQNDNCEEIWFYYSGHGSRIYDDICEDVICPSDYRETGVIIDYELFNIIKFIKCRAFILMDCCHSGTVCKLEWSHEYLYDTGHIRLIRNDDFHTVKNSEIFMFSSCKNEQISRTYYHPDLKDYIGVFTGTFLEILRKSNYTISLYNLYHKICVSIREKGFEQTPIFSSTSSFQNYVLVKAFVPPLETHNPYFQRLDAMLKKFAHSSFRKRRSSSITTEGEDNSDEDYWKYMKMPYEEHTIEFTDIRNHIPFTKTPTLEIHNQFPFQEQEISVERWKHYNVH